MIRNIGWSAEQIRAIDDLDFGNFALDLVDQVRFQVRGDQNFRFLTHGVLSAGRYRKASSSWSVASISSACSISNGLCVYRVGMPMADAATPRRISAPESVP